MTSRERFYAAVTHRPVDRAVFDLCGCPQTLIDCVPTRAELARLLGITGEKRGDFCVDARVLEALDIDTRLVGGMPTPRTRHKRREGDIVYDSWGIGSRFISGHMEMCRHPLEDCTIDEMLAYEFPDPDAIDRGQIARWAEQARFLKENTDYAVIAEHPVFGVLELGCWLFGFDDFLYRLAGEPELVHAFFGRVLEYQKRVIDIYYGALGRYIDCTPSGDDFGTQTGPFMSAAMFDDCVKPYMQARIAWTRRHTDAFYQHHTCGSVYRLIPSLIDCGVDILNPIQPGARDMECERLKRDFGDRIAFWGGIDTQHILPEGSEEDVKAEVRRVLAAMGDSGYVLSPAHTIQEDVPARNLLAIYTGAAEYYR